MRWLTGTDSARPTVNMCRQDQISTLAARRRFYLALGGAPNSTELQLPRLRGADNTCKRHHSQPLPVQIFSLLFTPSDQARRHWNALAMEKDDVHISKGVFYPSLDVFFYWLVTSCPTYGQLGQWWNILRKIYIIHCELGRCDMVRKSSIVATWLHRWIEATYRCPS